MSLKGKVALVTGGSRGIGRAVCLELARQGADVAVNYAGNEAAAQETAQACRELGVRAVVLRADVADAAACDAMVAQVLEQLGRLDILVNNAGITRDGLMLRMPEADWDAVLDTNLKGAFHCMRAAYKTMMRQKSGRVVNISSVVGLRGNAGQTNYSASKAGLIGLSKSLAKELATRNVTVNVVAPGFITTDMTDALPEGAREALLSTIPMKRLGAAEDVARAVAFFAGEGAGKETAMEKRRVVITGLGAVTPLGHTARETWEAAKAGVCGIAPITLYDHSAQKVSLAGEVKEFDPSGVLEKKEIRRMDRFAQFAVTAAAEAMAHSGLDLEREDRARIGVALSSGIGGIGTLQTSCETGQSRGFDRVSPFFIPMVITNLAAGHIAIRFGLHGMCICPVAACAGGANAVGDAFRHIRDGYAEVMVAGGAEASITPLAMGGFTSMSALTDASDPSRASIPFDKERSGFVMGEGAAVLILEELEHARARGAQILGEITGYGATCDAYHITAPDPEGAWSAACMEQALADAGLAPEAVDYINAHGTSTPLNDSGETAAIRRVFGAHADRLMVSSTKSMTGHLLGASGAVEAALCVLALKDGFVPATINYQVPDPACDLDIVPNEGREADIRCAISNSLGFGGHNACLVFQKWEG